ncbi:MAG: PilZ domain-containing protein, partial [Polyangia bacterium]
MRIRARLIVVAPELPEPLVDAVGRGVDARWVPDAAGAVAELRRLRLARLADGVRHRFTDVTVRWQGAAESAQLRNLSNDGFAFEVADTDVERLLPGSELEGLTLSRRGLAAVGGARALVRHVEPLATPGRYLVGCALKPRATVSTIRPTLLRDPALCAALFRSGLGTGVVVTPHDADAHDGAAELQLVGGRVDTARGVVTAVCDGTLAEHDLVNGYFELAGRLYRFTTVVIAAAPLTLKLPAVLEETLQRASARYRPASNEALVVEVRSPLTDAVALKTIVDLSAAGFSFSIDGARDLYPLGLRLDVTLRLPDGPLACGAQVRTLVREAGRLRCGVELVGIDAPSRLRLANFVMRLRFPGVDDGAGLGCDALFDFLRETGFLTPAKEESLRPVVDEVRQSFEALYATPSTLFKAVVAREDGALVGHVSGVRAYRHTWMAQHLTARPTVHVGHLLNLGAAEYFCQNPDFEYFKIYFHADNKWPARVFGGFARMLRDPQQSELRIYRHLALRTDAPLPPAADGVDVLEASVDDLAAVERYFMQRERGLLLRADDLTRQTLQLSELNKRFGALGLYRRRRVLCAMRKNVCLGFALAELSSPGLNLSEALSAFQIFVTNEGQADADRVRRSLLQAVLPIYRHAGRPIARGLIAADEIADW